MFTLEDRDFRVRSFRSNLVLRWEWRPGSTLYVIWQQDRFGSAGASFFVSSCCSHYSTVISKLSDENRIMAQRLTGGAAALRPAMIQV